MTSETFILLLKAKYKRYFENGESVGLEVAALVEDFREAVISDFLKKKNEQRKIYLINKKLKNGNA